ncbi:hypothetical protein P175DRAFT_0343013 [Aspergillus ochraceoroseus IBT 24754]|uniref:Zn(2)-C6 fungal-type domain-containing protein n=3 Tax=Aspergillus subgen. Nidulantes TaxID=2720870 RepID=A0A0F8ULP3_9EURO|nr:uncharacterized protein P175DRAFT_0343013 [Aspergillus ochraceoroseus IBT 24754]KKK11853.1 hypothetical protein AOCH_001017 [Aspergillus ochraceoroseus]KKK20443.1 hypothetical protein ARAM_002911 [Aspergillus rambellii]PTU19025.1 hypothetical protein P175DRAFT_0343013 [Aspergillus ochraceoroseus IBT 24754]
MPSNSAITKKACDGCKVRKIRCGGGQPCHSCINARVKCTYLRAHQRRGPQKLRPMTKFLIEQAQGTGSTHSAQMAGDAGDDDVRSTQSERSRIPVNVLASPLYIYHAHMYPVWPIVDVENILFTLQQDGDNQDYETYALAAAVAAGTIAQLRLGEDCLADQLVSADTFAQECMKARRFCDYRSRVNLNNVRTAFFLHVYYENMESGGSESLLYLREAISLAQMMYLHREASYAAYAPEEQQIRRRVLWLLYITERGVCILHKLPIVLKTDIATPQLDASADPQVLPAFLKLLALFTMFEQSRMFEILEDHHLGTQSAQAAVNSLDARFVDLLHGGLRDGSPISEHISDVQRADLCVTWHWMRILLWKALSKQSVTGQLSAQSPVSPFFPVLVAKELLNIVSQLPRTALEAHGLGMEMKLYEVANSLADAVISLAVLPQSGVWDTESPPSSILTKMHSMLCSLRGGGKKNLAEVLYKKMAEVHYTNGPALSPTVHDASRPIAPKHLTAAIESASNSGAKTTVADVNLVSRSNTIRATDLDERPATQCPENDHVHDDDDDDANANKMEEQEFSNYSPPSWKDMIFSDFLDAEFRPERPHSFCTYDQFPATLGQPWLDSNARDPPFNLSLFSPSLPVGSVDMLLEDFIAQDTATRFPGETDMLVPNSLADQPSPKQTTILI